MNFSIIDDAIKNLYVRLKDKANRPYLFRPKILEVLSDKILIYDLFSHPIPTAQAAARTLSMSSLPQFIRRRRLTKNKNCFSFFGSRGAISFFLFSHQR